MKPPIRIIVEVQGGCVQAIYGDCLPEDIEVDFIVRDLDDIEDDDENYIDSVAKDYVPDVRYW